MNSVASHPPESDGLRQATDSPQGLSVSGLSPCISVCCMNETSGLCEGCFRTLDEIALWSVLDDGDKRAIWQQLDERRIAATPAALP